MSGKLAYRAGLCYNQSRNIVVSEDAVNTFRLVTYLIRRQVTVNTLPPHAQDGNTPQKRCAGPCGRMLPATPEFFRRNKQLKDGLRGQCKSCLSQYEKERYLDPDIRERRHASNNAYHSRPEIRERLRIRSQAYGVVYRQTHKEQWEQYYQKNGEQIRARVRDYSKRPDIRERKSAYDDVYYARPEIQERVRNYSKSHDKVYRSRPEVQEASRIRSLNRLVQKRAISGTYTPQQIQDKLKAQKYKCYYCSAKFEKKNDRYIYHIDHTFPISRVTGTDIPANDISYLVLACPICNIKKGNKFPWEFPEGGRLL